MQHESKQHSVPFQLAFAGLTLVAIGGPLGACEGADPGTSDVAAANLSRAGAPAPTTSDRETASQHGKAKHRHHPHRCPNADDPSTPGDDRPNFVQCGESLSCGPDTAGCCSLVLECAPLAGQCPNAGPSFTCDGPEDCPNLGERCWGGMVAPMCATQGPFLKCHTDADCTEPSRPACSDAGSCVES